MVYENLLNQSVVVTLNVQKKYAGVVRKVANDFVLLDDSESGACLVHLEHAKKLTTGSENSASSSRRTKRLRFGPFDHQTLPDTLVDVLQGMQDSVIRLECGSPDAITGYLMAVHEDFVVVGVIPDGSVYLPIHHIQTVLPLDVSVSPEFLHWLHSKQICPGTGWFADILQASTGEMVRLGRGGPEDVSGILKTVHDVAIELVVSPHEVVWMPVHHIKAFCRVERRDGQPEQPTTTL